MAAGAETSARLQQAVRAANGSRQPVLQGTPSKTLYAAFSNQSGVLSALLAERGVAGECDAFEGEAGPFTVAKALVNGEVVLADFTLVSPGGSSGRA